MCLKPLLAAALVLLPAVACASETITYGYDAKGRLTTVTHSGSVNNTVSTTYSYDPADIRTQVTTSGAQNVIVVPLRGLKIIPINAPAF